MAMDLIVGLFLLYLNLFSSGYYFGRTMVVLLGYGLVNWSISIFMDEESDSDEEGNALIAMGCGSIFMLVAFFMAMSFADFFVTLLDILEEAD